MRSAVLFGLVSVAAAQVSTLVSELNSINSMTGSLAAYIPTVKAIGQTTTLLQDLDKLKSAINGAASTAKGLGSVSAADQATILTTAESLYPNIIKSLTATVQNSFLQSATFAGVTSSQLGQLQTATDSLSSALVADATGAYSGPASTVSEDIDAAFSSALQAQVPNSAVLPSVPAASGGASSASASASATGTVAPTSASASASVYSVSSAPVYSVSSAPVSTAPVYSATSAPVYSSAPVYTSAPPAPIYGTTSAIAPVYTGAAAKVGAYGGAVVLAVAAMAI